jgi:hypothetical protein
MELPLSAAITVTEPFFKVTKVGREVVLHSFGNGSDGLEPYERQAVAGSVPRLTFFIAGLLYLLRFKRVDNWERIASRRRPAFSSHLLSTVTRGYTDNLQGEPLHGREDNHSVQLGAPVLYLRAATCIRDFRTHDAPGCV